MQTRHAQDKQKTVEWARKLLSENAIVLDFETTALKNAEIVQIGAIDMQGETLMSTLVRPSGRIPSSATTIHGITDDMVVNAPTFKDVYIQLSVLLAGRTVVAYNVDYDREVLNHVCRLHTLPVPRAGKWECAMKTYAVYWGAWNNSRASYSWQRLTAACEQQQIVVADAHSAAGDCLMTLALIRKMAEAQSQ